VIRARAPGRVNLIGEHTDYNDGFVLPCAIDRFTVVESEPHDDRTMHVESLRESDDFDLDSIERTGTWRDYVRGVVERLQLERGASLRIESDVPRGAGLSSSASLEVAVGRALSELTGEELALLCQRAENEFVGVQSGIMDQFAVTLGRADHALLLDCRDLTYRHIPIPDGVAIVVCDSHIRRKLAASGYNDRRAECEAAAAQLGLTSLRDATLDQVAGLPRARHVVSENERTLRAAAALESGDCATFGSLMDASHVSMRDDFEIVPPELDALAAAMRAVDGCYGSRLTGGGFGGCTVSLVDAEAVTAVDAAARELGATVYVCRASDGASRAEKDSRPPWGRRESVVLPLTTLDSRDRRRGVLRLRERARLDGDRRGLRGDRDRLARCRVATLPLLRRRAHPCLDLDDPADLHLLCLADLLDHDVLECRDRFLRICTRQARLLGDRVGELSLRHCHSEPPPGQFPAQSKQIGWTAAGGTGVFRRVAGVFQGRLGAWPTSS
jgi:galactokinase